MNPDDFDRFYQEVHGYDPFPWQSDLVREVVSRGSWPSLVDAPTGLGKTSILDIAVFVLALGHQSTGSAARRRIFLVVDRRVVVDQAEAHALKIADRLRNAPAGSVSEMVANRLRTLGSDPGEEVLSVVKMRGGSTWESAWLKRPDAPAIITGTVDQIGSRLLFRGYGASVGRRPIDAALVGTDSLILVDEAHLATVLVETLAAVEAHDTSREAVGLPTPAIVRLTATSGDTGGWVPEFDEASHLAVPTARGRLTAGKALELRAVPKAKAPKELAQAARSSVVPGSRVLVVCNTVDRARAVHKALEGALPGGTSLSLLIGRSRPLDREEIVAEALGLFGADRDPDSRSAVLIATQTVEVGVDLDATALITELASWDALVQRLGRLNRRGTQETTHAIVFDDGDDKRPVYGPAASETGTFLRALGADEQPLDVSPLALRNLTVPGGVLRPDPPAPVLLPAHLDAWSRTSPAPANDAPLDPYLHGIDGGVAPVSVAWRVGLLDQEHQRTSAAVASALLKALPVRQEECIEVPIGALRRWLEGGKAVPVSDLDDDDWDIPFDAASDVQILRRDARPDGEMHWRWISSAELRPGDSIVVPSSSGGLDKFGWDPASTDPVPDVAELAALHRGHLALRLDEGLPARLGVGASGAALRSLADSWCTEEDHDERSALEDTIRSTVGGWLTEELLVERPVLRHLADALDGATLSPLHVGESNPPGWCGATFDGVLLTAPSPRAWERASDDDSDGTVHLSRQVTLQAHLEAVATRAGLIADALGLPEGLRRAVVDAARWHDLGKSDPRFQAMLFDGNRMLADLAAEPLAKSGMPPEDQARQRRARALSGLPRRARHEAWSEVLVAEGLRQTEDAYEGDTDLLLHLIASHHGHGRPLLPLVADNGVHQLSANLDGIEVTSDLPRGTGVGAADRFARLNHRYGRWGLAMLESVVRCADMTVSQEGS